MTETLAPHPPADRLSAFGLGLLTGEDRDAVEEHVAHCETCAGILAHPTVGDNVLQLVRDAIARNRTSVGPGTLAQSMVAPTDSLPDPAPPFLHNHPRYRVIRSLGIGGMGEVYLAEHRLMKRPVALKVLRGAALMQKDGAKRFLREVEAAAKLHHPNIVAAFDAEEIDGNLFLAMEYVDGINLHMLVIRDGPLSVATACDYIRQAADGLQHAHDHGMIHRDIKPSNLMLTRKPVGVVKVLDFGLVRLADPGPEGRGLTNTGFIMGTPDFIAPEQATDTTLADARSDVYSLGCTLFSLLTGRELYPTGTALEKVLAHKYTPPPPIASVRPDVPMGVAAVLEKMLAKEPANRFQSAAEVSKVLAGLIAAGLPSGPAGPVAPPAAKTVQMVGDPTPTRPRPKTTTATRKLARKKREQAKRRKRYVLAGLFALFVVLWATWPPMWEIVPPPPWGHRWMIENGRIPGESGKKSDDADAERGKEKEPGKDRPRDTLKSKSQPE